MRWNANSQPEKVSVTETVWAPGHTTYYDKKNSLWRMGSELVQDDDTIGNTHIDPWVHKVSEGAITGSEELRAQKARIDEAKMEPNAHRFANDLVDPLNWPRSEKAFVPNGSNAAWTGPAYVHPAA
jgi:hypothetical protein